MEKKNTTPKKVWFITGTSTGFGRKTAIEALENGHYVIATARNVEDIEDLNDQYSDRVLTLPLDVTDPDSIKAAVEKGVERHHRIDILMNNAGYGTGGTIEETSDEDARQQFDVNVFGLLNVTKAALPTFREQNDGLIINLSSMGGLVSMGGIGVYCATKFAVEGLTESLAEELRPLGVKTMLVEPGAFDTEFAGNMKMAKPTIDDYKHIHEAMEEGFDFKGDPEKAAAAIVAAATSSVTPTRLVLGSDALDAVNEKLHLLHENLDEWEGVTRATAKSDSRKIEELIPS